MLYPFKTGGLATAEPPSANYDLQLPIDKYPYSLTKRVSQSITPASVDRFTLTLIPDYKETSPQFVFRVSVALIYNEDNKTVKAPSLLFTFPRSAGYKMLYFRSQPVIAAVRQVSDRNTLHDMWTHAVQLLEKGGLPLPEEGRPNFERDDITQCQDRLIELVKQLDEQNRLAVKEISVTEDQKNAPLEELLKLYKGQFSQ